MVHHRNLKNVLLHGLHSHNKAYEKGLIIEDISMPEVQVRRHGKTLIVSGTEITLHEFASFYFNTRNPMLYARRDQQPELVILLISADIINTSLTDSKFAVFSDGNASSNVTRFFNGVHNLVHLDFPMIYGSSWNDLDPDIKRENKRKRCAEVLVHPGVEVVEILKIICPNLNMYDCVTDLITSPELKKTCQHIEVELSPGYFF
jgi:hypothetical protein